MRPKEFMNLLRDNLNTLFWPTPPKMERLEFRDRLSIRIIWKDKQQSVSLSKWELRLYKDPYGLALEMARQVYADFTRER